MAAKAKQVKKGDIRRLMKKSKSKINSPLAKYSASGQLTCVLCSMVVKNELLWPAHVNGKIHKENVTNVKSGKSPISNTAPVKIPKRKHEVLPSSSSGTLPSDFFEGATVPKVRKLQKSPSPVALPQNSVKPVGILKNKSGILKNKSESKAIPSNGVSITNGIQSEKSVTVKLETMKLEPLDLPKPSMKSALPLDFHDPPNNRQNGSKQTDTSKQPSPSETNEQPEGSSDLPDGFFDDPIEDAKVHHKQYVDPMEKEWELFQKEIKMEAHKSVVIEVEDEDVMTFKRNLSEVDDQIAGWAKVEALHIKKETFFIKTEVKTELKTEVKEEVKEEGEEMMDTGEAVDMEVTVKVEPKDSDSSEEETDSDGEEEFSELLDWRSKGT